MSWLVTRPDPSPLARLPAPCDREPIHIPERIQPQGILLAFDGSGELVAASDNTEGWFDAPLELGAPIGAFADPGLSVLVERMLGARTIATQIHRAATRKGVVPMHVHRNPQGLLIVELWEDCDDARTEAAMRGVHQLTSAILAVPDTREALQALFDQLVRQISEALGFDRTMLYRFHPDNSGEVVAEYRVERMDSFSSLRFPESDIPAQARALCVRQPLRFVRDASYVPVPLKSRLGEPLDMSGAVLRSVSPIHCLYLSNMGVCSSLSISIVVDGALWGIITHHGLRPHSVPLALWPMLELLSSVLSTKVHAVELAERSRGHVAAAHVAQFLLARLNASSSLSTALVEGSPNISDLVECSGTVVMYEGRRSAVGRPPEIDPALLPRLLADAPSGVLAIDGGVPELSDAGSPGVLAFGFDDSPENYVAWFRPEVVKTVNWAGAPDEKPVVIDEHGIPKLTPRRSFAVWSETVSGTSEPWSAQDRASAVALRESLGDVLARISSSGALSGGT